MAAGINILPFPIRGAAYRVIFPIFDSSGDISTGAGSDTPDTEVSKDCGTFTDCTNELTEIATNSGIYYLDLTYTEMTADVVAIIAKTASDPTTPIVLYPRSLPSIRAATAQAGAEGTITLDASASADDDFYNGCYVLIDGNTGQGQARLITGYVGSTRVATIAPNWATNPDNSSTFSVLVPENAMVAGWAGAAVADTDAAGYPIVTVKDGTGQGELNLASGVVDANAVQITGTAQRATDLAEIAQYLFANAATLTDIIADDAVIAQMLASGGDISDYDDTTDSQEAISVALATADGNIDTILAGTVILSTTIASDGRGKTSCRLAAGSDNDDMYIGMRVILDSDAGDGEYVSRTITDYASTNKVVTWTPAIKEDAQDGGNIYIVPGDTKINVTADAILDDTDLIDDATSGLAKIATDVAAILVDTDTGVAIADGYLDTAKFAADFLDSTLVADNAFVAANFAADVGNEFADALLVRNVSNVEATAGEHTLCTAILGALEFQVVDTTLTIFRTDGTTTHATKEVSTEAGAESVWKVA